MPLCPAGTDGENRERQRGCAGAGLTWGSEQDLTPSFSGKEICFARTNHWHAFFISVIIPKKGCGEALGYLLPLGEFDKGRRKEGSRAEWQLLLVFCCGASKLIFPISSDLMPKPAQTHRSYGNISEALYSLVCLSLLWMEIGNNFALHSLYNC